MPTETTKSIFLTGAREASPFILVVGPFGLLFGVVATEAGLNVLETMTFSILVIAGAAQLTALQLMTENAPAIIVIISALAVNLRMAMYSASLAPYIGPAPLWQRALAAYFLVDQSYGLAAVKYETEPAWTVRQRMAYFFGTIAPVCPFWYLSTLAGALIGSSVPESRCAGLPLEPETGTQVGTLAQIQTQQYCTVQPPAPCQTQPNKKPNKTRRPQG